MYKNNNAKNEYLYLKKKSLYKRKKKFIYNSKLKIVGTFGRKFFDIKCKIYKYLYILIFFISFILLTNFMIKILYHKTNLKQSYLDINSKEEFPKLYESFNNAKEFIDKSLKGILINNKTIKSTKHPKVSAIIPIYNCDKTITRAIRSIQNQNIINIEIILVNDFSTDETLSMVEEFQKEDPRIKIINNQKNMGILYSRSIGALSAKGEYIFPLDNDDMLLDEDSYSTITQIADRAILILLDLKQFIPIMDQIS